MSSATRTLSAAALAAAAMYWFDPASGRRRRARLRDQVQHTTRRIGRGLDAGVHDLAHRVLGVAAEVRGAFNDMPSDDVVVAERIRSAMGRVVSHPGAIDVTVDGGRVELKGAILAQELPRLMHAVWAVHGVQAVHDALGVYESARGISALQGGRNRDTRQFGLLQERWTPGARLLINTTGLLLTLYGLRHRGVPGLLGCVAGGALLARGTTNMPLRKFAGATAGVIGIQKHLRVNAPVGRVFEALSRYDNFPYFMRNVRSVRVHPDGRSHWCLKGPMGTTLEWDAETVAYEPDELIAWRTVAHAPIQHSGSIRLRGENGTTCLEIRMCYSPPAGMLGHGLAKLLGADPKKELDEDLLRLKTFLETGTPAHDRAARGASGGLGDAVATQTAASAPMGAAPF